MAKKDYRCDTCGEKIFYRGKGRPARFCSTCKTAPVQVPSSIKPLPGVPVMPPDVPQDTVLKHSAPKLMELTVGHPDPWSGLAVMAEDADAEVDNVERRITLLARYIMEATLWESAGLSKKERFDAAVSAVRTLEGTKSNVWTKSAKDENLPASQKKFFEEKKVLEERLVRLVQSRDRLGLDKKEAAEVAQQLVAIEKGNVVEGEA